MSNLIDLSLNDDKGIAAITRANWTRTGEALFNGDLDLTFIIDGEDDAAIVGKYVPGALLMYKSGVAADTAIDGVRRGMSSGTLRGRPVDRDISLKIADAGREIISDDCVVRSLVVSWDGPLFRYTMRVRFEKVAPEDIAEVMRTLAGEASVWYAARQLSTDGANPATNGDSLPPEPVA